MKISTIYLIQSSFILKQKRIFYIQSEIVYLSSFRDWNWRRKGKMCQITDRWDISIFLRQWRENKDNIFFLKNVILKVLKFKLKKHATSQPLIMWPSMTFEVILHVMKKVISRQIRPLAALYPLTPLKKVLYRAAISSFALSGRWGRYTHVYGICAPFYCISLK